jgi:hypothetical protein
MKLFKILSITLFSIITILGCKPKTEKSTTEENTIEHSSTKKTTIQEKYSFHKTLTLQTISFEIKTTGEGAIRKLTIQPKGLEIDNRIIEIELDGQVIDAEIEDLNSDGFPEILIYTISAGSGSYGNVIGYSINNGKSISQIYFPELSENKEASKGYMGHDEFAIVETSLVRRFPIYKSEDSNSNPTGGTRQIAYTLKNGEASRLFVITKINDYE